MMQTKGHLIAGGFVALTAAIAGVLIMVKVRSESEGSGGFPKGGTLPSTQERLSDGTGATGAPEAKGNHVNSVREMQGELTMIPELLTTHLILKGTVAGGNTMRYAIVVDTRDDRQYLLKIGDTVEGATVKRIERNKVDLISRGRMITLRASAASSDGSPAPFQADRSTPPYTREELMQRYDPYQERAAEVEALRKQIVIHPNQTAGVSSGVLVSQIEPGSLFETMGLKKGDIIISVDGKRIETLDDSMELFECLGTSLEGTLSITRDGRPAALTYRSDMQ